MGDKSAITANITKMVKVLKRTAEALEGMDINSHFDLDADLRTELSSLEDKLRTLAKNCFQDSGIDPKTWPFKNVDATIAEVEKKSQQAIAEVEKKTQQEIEVLKEVNMELRVASSGKRNSRAYDSDTAGPSTKKQKVKFAAAESEDEGNLTSFEPADATEDEGEDSDGSIEDLSNTKKKKSSSKGKIVSASSSSVKTSDRKTKSKGDGDAADNFRRCLDMSLFHCAKKGAGKDALSETNIASFCCKASCEYLYHLMRKLINLFFAFEKKKNPHMKTGSGCHVKFISIFSDYLPTPKEKKKIYDFTVGVFFRSIPDNFSVNFARNTQAFLFSALNYMFRLPVNDAYEEGHNGPFRALYEAWDTGNLDISKFRSMNTSLGNLFFFAEDPVRMVESVFTCLRHGTNHLLGDKLDIKQSGYYKFNYKTNTAESYKGTRPKVPRDLENLLSFNRKPTYYVSDGRRPTFTPRWAPDDKEKFGKSLLEDIDGGAFPFEREMPTRAAFKYLYMFNKIACESENLSHFYGIFPETFNPVMSSSFLKNNVQLTETDVEPCPCTDGPFDDEEYVAEVAQFFEKMSASDVTKEPAPKQSSAKPASSKSSSKAQQTKTKKKVVMMSDSNEEDEEKDGAVVSGSDMDDDEDNTTTKGKKPVSSTPAATKDKPQPVEASAEESDSEQVRPTSSTTTTKKKPAASESNGHSKSNGRSTSKKHDDGGKMGDRIDTTDDESDHDHASNKKSTSSSKSQAQHKPRPTVSQKSPRREFAGKQPSRTLTTKPTSKDDDDESDSGPDPSSDSEDEMDKLSARMSEKNKERAATTTPSPSPAKAAQKPFPNSPATPATPAKSPSVAPEDIDSMMDACL